MFYLFCALMDKQFFFQFVFVDNVFRVILPFNRFVNVFQRFLWTILIWVGVVYYLNFVVICFCAFFFGWKQNFITNIRAQVINTFYVLFLINLFLFICFLLSCSLLYFLLLIIFTFLFN